MVSRPGDRWERDAERTAKAVLGPKTDPRLRVAPMDTPDGTPDGTPVDDDVAGGLRALEGRGTALAPDVRSDMETRFGHRFDRVRIHTDTRADALATRLDALAFTVGQHVAFARGRYDPSKPGGSEILAHELTHVVQQQGSTPSAIMGVFRVTPALCAAKGDCGKPDAAGTGSASAWKVTLAVDKEEEGIERLVSGNVGHTWIKFDADDGEHYSYGFWPQSGFDPSEPTKSVPGCVHHPDKAHEPPAATDYLDIDYTVKSADYAAGLTHAESKCKSRPDYNLFSYNCTTFAIDVAKAAGISPPPSSSLAVDNPNALYEGIEEERKKRGSSGGSKKGGGSGGGKKSGSGKKSSP